MPTVLVASDAKWVRDHVRGALCGPGFELLEVERGRDVRQLVDERHPDLVIVDLQIANMGGMAVNPGDIIVGDADGVVAIPQADAERILALTQAQKAKEDATLASIAAGKPIDRSWVDKMLREKGCSLP